MDGLGIRQGLFQMAERIASHGYYVFLPDMFYRSGPYTPDLSIFLDPEKRKVWVEKYILPVTIERVTKDTAAFLDFLAAQPDVKQPRVGATGYCMGGMCSIAAAGHFPERIAAAASYHGGRLATDAQDSPHLLASRMKARVYVIAASNDPVDQTKRLEESLKQAGVQHTVETEEKALHGFVPPDSPVHDKEAAERHWKTLFNLFDSTLDG
jgi:carboxymethylenebutenolidase